MKIEDTQRLGASVVFHDRRREDREQIGRDLAVRTGAVVVPSYDDRDIIAGTAPSHSRSRRRLPRKVRRSTRCS